MGARMKAYDNIRLLRRKVNIAQDEVARLTVGPQRDAAVVRVAALTDDLVRALQDFADMGYEEDVARLIAGEGPTDQRNVFGLH